MIMPMLSPELLYLYHKKFKKFFHPAKFDNFKDETISDYKTVSCSKFLSNQITFQNSNFIARVLIQFL